MTVPPGGLFRGPPGYRACSPWGPLQALAVVAAVEGLGFVGVRLLVAAVQLEELLALMIFQAVAIVLIVAVSGLMGAHAADVLALRRPARGWRAYVDAVLAMLLFRILSGILLAIVLAIALFAVSFDLTGDWQRDQSLVQTTDVTLQIGAIVIGAPLSEELVYRGFLLSALARTRLGFWGAALTVTALWTALHDYSAVGFVSVFIMGLILAWLLWRTGSLRVTIFCHALNNAAALLAHQFLTLPLPP